MTHILQPEQHWVCPNCVETAITHESRPHTEMHQCRGLAGMLVPMVPEGVKAKVELVGREDWVGDEMVRTDAEGRPWMAALTTRDDGTDVAVYAPTAQATGSI